MALIEEKLKDGLGMFEKDEKHSHALCIGGLQGTSFWI